MRARILLLAGALLLAGCGEATDAANEVVRTTTAVAGANIVGLERDTTNACAPPAPAEGRADPRRIVVIGVQALDTVCALGLWERVVGAVTVDGPAPRPEYLGSGIAAITAVGPSTAPDLKQIADLRPDLILGTEPAPAADELRAIAPTTLAPAGDDWQQQVRVLAAALGRPAAAERALQDYRAAARDAGVAMFANQTQASVVTFTSDGESVQGITSFPGRVLGDVGVQRPPAQRAGSFDLDPGRQAAAEGDVIFVSFAPGGRAHGADVMQSEAWKDLSAAGDKRVWVVDDAIWHGAGIVAAHALLDDLRTSLNDYGS